VQQAEPSLVWSSPISRRAPDPPCPNVTNVVSAYRCPVLFQDGETTWHRCYVIGSRSRCRCTA